MDIPQRFKGLINGRVWESGSLKLDDNGLTVIHRDDNDFYVFEDSISRFTGHKNSYGDEIYEGDLLASEKPDGKGVQQVFWDEVFQQWKVGPSPKQDPLLSQPLESSLDYSIVGHEFTHQHLLRCPDVYIHNTKKNH